MCLDPISAGIITFASNALSTIGSYSQQRAEYNAQMEAFRRSEEAYNQQIRLNQDAANRGYMSEQQKLQGEFMKASQEAQGRLVASLQSQGSVLASGRTGQSIGLLLSDAEREYGRDLANIAQNLAFNQQDYFTGTEGIYQNAVSANNAAASNRMLQPSAPSSIGLVAGLASAAASGVSAYASLKAPAATIGGKGSATAGGLSPSQIKTAFNIPKLV